MQKCHPGSARREFKVPQDYHLCLHSPTVPCLIFHLQHFISSFSPRWPCKSQINFHLKCLTTDCCWELLSWGPGTVADLRQILRAKETTTKKTSGRREGGGKWDVIWRKQLGGRGGGQLVRDPTWSTVQLLKYHGERRFHRASLKSDEYIEPVTNESLVLCLSMNRSGIFSPLMEAD